MGCGGSKEEPEDPPPELEEAPHVGLGAVGGYWVELKVRLLNSEVVEVRTRTLATLWMLKEQIYELDENVKPEDMVIMRGADAQRGNLKTLSDLGIATKSKDDGTTLTVVKSLEEHKEDELPPWIPPKKAPEAKGGGCTIS